MEMTLNTKEQFLSTKMSKIPSPNKTMIHKPIDQLNEWSYVNPGNQDDDLPQPYRTINKIIQEDILKGVFQQIFDIEKYKADPNYEGHLKSLPPQGSFDIPHITCVCKEGQQSNHNHVLAGDAYGSIMILDLNKKMRVGKKEVGNGKRISKIAIGSRDFSTDEQQTIQNVAVIAHLDPNVYIYRYRLGENKLYLHYTIQITKEEENNKLVKIVDLPVDISFSLYSQFLQVTQFNGNITIYKIPDLTSPKIVDEEAKNAQLLLSKQKVNVTINPVPQQQPKQVFFPDSKAPILQTSSIASHLEVKPTILSEVFYKVVFNGIKVEPKYMDMIQNLRQEYLKPQVEAQNPVASKDDKKKAAPAKPDPKKVEEQVVQVVVSDEFETNQSAEQIEHVKAEDGLDVSQELPEQRFRASSHFIQESSGFNSNQKIFNSLKRYEIIVGLVVTWSNSYTFEIHTLQSSSKFNLPEYIQLKFTQSNVERAGIDGQVQLTQISNPPQPKFVTSISQMKTIYPISVISVSQSSSFIAVGLQQGSIVVYDLSTSQEKFYLDKHQACVTHVLFCDDWRLVTGAQDGTVHIYDLLEQGKLVMKRTNQFRKKKIQVDVKKGDVGIAFLGVSSSGVAVALDYQQEIRLYDIWHGEKIGKLTAQQVMDDKKRIWSVSPQPVMICGKAEIIIIAEMYDQSTTQQEIDQQQSKGTKNTCLQIFKIFDNLINLFPALSNVYRRGIDKEKIIHLYCKIDGASLKDPNFVVPSLAHTDLGQNMLVNPLDRKSPSKSRKSLFHKNLNMSQSKTISNNKEQTINSNKASLVNSLHGSSISDSNQDFNSSFRSQLTRNSRKDVNHKLQKNNVLTKQMLHPEQFLLEKVKVPVPKVINDNQLVIEHCRSRNLDRMVRAERVNSLVTKLGNNLQVADEKRVLEEKQRLLLNTKSKKS